jgi:hypothetical protein
MRTAPASVEVFSESVAFKARDKAAAFTSRAARTLDKAEAIVTAAEREPDRFGPLVAEMDRKGKVDGAYPKLRRTRTSA